MQNDIFDLLMIILMMQCGNSTENINQLILMFLMMESRCGSFSSDGCPSCRDDGYTF